MRLFCTDQKQREFLFPSIVLALYVKYNACEEMRVSKLSISLLQSLILDILEYNPIRVAIGENQKQ